MVWGLGFSSAVGCIRGLQPHLWHPPKNVPVSLAHPEGFIVSGCIGVIM